MVSLLGFINGITVIVWVILGVVYGLFSIYRSRKTSSKYLFLVGMIVIFISLLFLGLFIDFMLILITGKNLDNSDGLHGILSFMWFGPLVFMFYLLADIIFPDLNPHLKQILLLYIFVLCVIFEFFLFTDPFNSINFQYPDKSGENLIDNTLIEWSPLFLLLSMTLVPALFVGEIILLNQSIKSSGIVRKKLLFLFFAIILFFGVGSLDILIFLPDISLIVIRCIMISGGILFYFSIKQERVELKNEPLKEDKPFGGPKISLVQTLSYSRPDDLSKDDIQYYRDQTLCIVCKTLQIGFTSIYICPECKSLYCKKCANELIQLDNMCWGCLGAIDKSKPIKPSKEEDTEIPIDISQIPQKKPKNKKKDSKRK